MSLRGSEATEAISKGIKKEEIAALPPVARNDNMELRHSLNKSAFRHYLSSSDFSCFD